jgi:hypothetical protein
MFVLRHCCQQLVYGTFTGIYLGKGHGSQALITSRSLAPVKEHLVEFPAQTSS